MGLSIFFAFWNGFTDAAYSISTIIGTRTLKPIHAVIMATIGSLVGMSLGSAVALTIGTGIVSEKIMSAELIISALIGALIFDCFTSWVYSLPISETHVLIGGLVGAGIAAGGLNVVKFQGIVTKVIIPMVTFPFIGMGLAFLIGCTLIRLFRGGSASKVNKFFRRSQVISAFLFSLAEGTNGAQKMMGIMTILLLYYGYLSAFKIPFWVMISCYSAISLGIFFGGWRVVKTMATKITRLRPYQGFTTELVSFIVLCTTAVLGIPMSSTHVANGAIMGVGTCQRVKAVKWITTRKIVVAWVLSMPLAAVMSFIVYNIIKFFV